MFLDKIITFALAAIFLFALSCEGPVTEESITEQDIPQKRTLLHEPAFWDYAASSNMLQVEIAKVAAENSASEQVRNIATEAARFHTKALKQLQQVVRKHKHINLPDSLGAADTGLILEFKLLEGEELDSHYREFVISTHNAQLDRYEEALLKADDRKTRTWLMDMRTHLRKEIHLLTASSDTAEATEE